MGCVPWNGRDTWKNQKILTVYHWSHWSKWGVSFGRSFNKKHAGVRRHKTYIYIYIDYDCHQNCNRPTQNCLPKSCSVSPFFSPSTRRPPSEQQHQQMMLGVPHSCKWLPESKHLAKAIALRHPPQALLSQMPCRLRQWPLWCPGRKWLYNCGNHTPKNLLML